ncbi:MAG: nucleotide sugar dehydrogenase [Acidobacteriota bacterium]
MQCSPSEALTIGSTDALAEKIRTRTARAGVIGLGYVGLPLAMELAEAGFSVLGFDTDPQKIGSLNGGISYIRDVDSEQVRLHTKGGRFQASADFAAISELDAVSIAVPTPLDRAKDPDMSFVIAAAEQVARHLHPGMLIILESTTYPGTTEEVLLPLFESTGLKVGADFFLCFSPERVDPGNPDFRTRNIPKVIGGVTPSCTEVGKLFYASALERVVTVSSSSAAEMVKILENTFRMVNIGLVNELALICDRMGINVWEVIDAAATKPFGYMPFYPGPGLGGHCIPIDPFYLAWKSRQLGVEARFIELAGAVNSYMPRHVVEKIQDALNVRGKPLRGAQIHVVGIAYKRDIEDIRESPALDIIRLLEQKGATVTYSDPYVPRIQLNGHSLLSCDLHDKAGTVDCVAIITNHSAIDYARLSDTAELIVDARNAMKDYTSDNVVLI